ncbi:MAG: TlpA family protein disulfide reductase [Spirochaetales bacterium]|nr:TlpA family protein disulfide reductase [Spirochaetales bacterium]
MKKWLLRIIYTAALLSIGFAIGFRTYSPYQLHLWEKEEAAKNEMLGSPAPDVSMALLDGGNWNLRDQKGKVILLDFWATWCEPCVDKIPELKRIYERYGDRQDFEIIGVSLDTDREALAELIKDESISWVQLFDEESGWENDLTKAFNIDGIPAVWIIDRENNISGVDLYMEEEILEALESSLNWAGKID